jgi:hypothetical protein
MKRPSYACENVKVYGVPEVSVNVPGLGVTPVGGGRLLPHLSDAMKSIALIDKTAVPPVKVGVIVHVGV